jgi:DNA-binding CsgD family transcriptional regulator
MTDIIDYSWFPPFKNTALLHQKYVQETQSLEQIASELKCSTQTVRKHLKMAGVKIRPLPHLRIPKGAQSKKISGLGKVIDLNEQRITQTILEYRRLGMSSQKIADIMNQMGIPPRFKAKSWHYRTVHRVIQQNGLGRVKLKRS